VIFGSKAENYSFDLLPIGSRYDSDVHRILGFVVVEFWCDSDLDLISL
jgi:hypothetical protein